MKDLSQTLSQIGFRKPVQNSNAVLVWNLALLISIAMVGTIYLFQINWLGTQGYRIKQVEQKIKHLEAEHKFLEVETSNMQSIARIQEELSSLKFVPVANIIYINDSDVALK